MKQPMILIVDDDEVARKNLIRLLSKSDNQVSGASNGTKSLSLLSENEYDVVLTDLVMDDINGLDLLAQVKKKHPGVEVSLITGYASIPSAIEAIKNGVPGQQHTQQEEPENIQVHGDYASFFPWCSDPLPVSFPALRRAEGSPLRAAVESNVPRPSWCVTGTGSSGPCLIFVSMMNSHARNSSA